MIHLLRLESIEHLDRDGNILWQQKNVDNLLHSDGQYYLLNLGFNQSSGITVPSSYYVGLDNRTTPDVSDTLTSLSNEPTQYGYSRQGVSSTNGFTLTETSGIYKATTDTVTFSASGGNYGPISNLFLATSSGSTGYLISTISFETERTVADGQTLVMRMSVSLKNC